MMNITVTGRLVKDAEIKTTKAGAKYAELRIASNYWNGTEQKTEWVVANVFGPRAENAEKYAKKGRELVVTGELRCRPWVDSNGNAQAGITIPFAQYELFGSNEMNQTAPAQRQAARPAPAPAAVEQPVEADDDELPF